MEKNDAHKAPTVGGEKKNENKKPPTKLEIQAKKKADEELKQKEAQAVLPGGKAVKRSKVIKLEFVPDTHGKLAQVAETIYNLDPPPAVASWNNLNWAVTDKMLYEQAKQEYDNVTQPFLRSPRVYRFESTKETIWNDLRKDKIAAEKKRKELEAYEAEQEKKRAEKQKERAAKGNQKLGDKKQIGAPAVAEEAAHVEVIEVNAKDEPIINFADLDEIKDTYLDPFGLNSSWRIEIDKKTGKQYYINSQTYEKTQDKPSVDAEIWREKLAKLGKLQRRADLDGYEYIETEKERRQRVRAELDYEKTVAEEIGRRLNRPTPLEQVEDVLYYLVDSIAKIDEDIEKTAKKQDKKERLKQYHMVTLGFKMKPIKQIVRDDGESEVPCTDLDVVKDLIITPTGHMLSSFTPPGLYQKFEKELEEKKKKAVEKALLFELERNRPMVDRVRLILAIYQNNPKRAYKEAIKLMRDKALSIPRKIIKVDKRMLLQRSKDKLVNGVNKMIEFGMNPSEGMSKLYKSINDTLNPKTAEELALENLIAQFEDAPVEVEAPIVVTESELDKQKRLWRESQPVPIKHADSVLVTMTLLAYPPPPYVRYPPRTRNKDKFLDKFDELSITAKTLASSMNVMPVLPDSITKALGKDEGASLFKRKLRKQILDSKISRSVSTAGQHDSDVSKKLQLVLREAGINLPSTSEIIMKIKEKTNKKIQELKNMKLPEYVDVPGVGRVPLQIPEKVDIPGYGEVNLKEITNTYYQQLPKIPETIKIPGTKYELPLSWNRLVEKTLGVSTINIDNFPLLDDETEVVDTNDIFDRSERLQWESDLVNDVGTSIGIPNRNIVIEEIQRIQKGDKLLKDLVNRNQEIGEQRKVSEQRKMESLLQDQAMRRALVEGKFLELYPHLFPPEVVARFLPSPTKDGNKVDGLDDDQSIGDTSRLDYTEGVEDLRIDTEINPLTVDSDIINDTHSPIGKESSTIETATIDTSNQIKIAPPQEEHVTREDSTIATLTSSVIAKLVPTDGTGKPEYFKIGIQNPDVAKYDPKYWLSKAYRNNSEEEKRRRRILRLKLARQENSLKKQLADIKAMKDDLLIIIQEQYLEPAYELLKPTLLELKAKVIDPLKLKTKNMIHDGISRIKHYRGDDKRLKIDSTYDQEVVDCIEHLLLEVEQRFKCHEDTVTGVIPGMEYLSNGNIGSDSAASVDLVAPMASDGLCNETGTNNESPDIATIASNTVLPIFEAPMKEEDTLVHLTEEEVVVVSKETVAEELVEKIEEEEEEEDPLWRAEEEARLARLATYQSKEEEKRLDKERKLQQKKEELEELERQRVAAEQALLELQRVQDGEPLYLVNRDWYQLRTERYNLYPCEVVDVLEELTLAVDARAIREESIALKERSLRYHPWYNRLEEDLVESMIEQKLRAARDKSEHHQLRALTFTFAKSTFEKLREMNELLGITIPGVSDAINRIADAAISEQDTEEVILDPTNLVGCKVSFMIFINDEVRKSGVGLEDLQSEDIAVMLRDQLHIPTSSLRTGKLSRYILDINYKTAYKQRTFDDWETYWQHNISPIFFGYHTAKNIKKEKSGPSNPHGIIVQNPSHKFSLREKELFIMLQSKLKKKKAGKKNDDDRVNIRPKKGQSKVQAAIEAAEAKDKAAKEKAEADKAAENAKKKKVFDLGEAVDEFAAELNDDELRIYRPKMNEDMTSRTVERTRRIYEEFEGKYEKEMKRGLVDGARLRKAQYDALKLRDEAFRVYNTCKQKLNQQNRSKESDDVIELKLTTVTSEMYSNWIQEIKDDDRSELIALREQKAKDKVKRDIEAELRRGFTAQREWVIKSLVCYHKFSAEFEPFLRKEIVAIRQKWERINTPGIPAEVLHQLTELRNQFKSLLISEEKNTRRLYDVVVQWAHRRRIRQMKMIKCMEECEERRLSDDAREVMIAAMVNSSEERRLSSLRMQDLTSNHGRHGSMVQIQSAHDMNEFELPTDPQELLLQRSSLFEFLDICKVEVSAWDYKQRLESLLESKRQVLIEEQSRLRSMAISKGFDTKEYEKEITVDDVVLLDTDWDDLGPKPRDTVWEQMLLSDELQLVLGIRWVSITNELLSFRSTLYNLPTMEPMVYNRDELIQASQIFTEIEPLFQDADAAIMASKDQAAISAGLMVAKEKRLEKENRAAERKRLAKEKAEYEAMKKTLSPEMQEAHRRLDEVRKMPAGMLRDEFERRALRFIESLKTVKDREKAWITAHPHKFIAIPGEAAFCIVCREREFESWLTTNSKSEEEWKSNYSKHTAMILMDKQKHISKWVETRRFYSYMNKVNIRKQFPGVVKGLMHDMIFQVEERVLGHKITDLPPDYELNTKLTLWKIPKLFSYRLPASTVTRQLQIANLPAEYEIPDPYILCGLSLLDCNGRVILPAQKLEESDAVKIKREKEMLDAMNQPEDDVLEMEKESNGTVTPLGLKIRIWDKVEVTVDNNTLYERGLFLGQIVLGYKDLINPPKGIRLYNLVDDERYIDTARINEGRLKITGNLSVKVTVTKKERVDGEEEMIPCGWKCEVLRANNIAVVNEKKLVNPYCEIMWRGPCEKGDNCYIISKWVHCGDTKQKIKTANPVWEREDTNLFDMPPVWTTHDIVGRGFRFGRLKGGAWCARNILPDEKTVKKDAKKIRKGFRPLKTLKRAAWAVYSICLMTLTSKESQYDETMRIIETNRIIMHQEETERAQMNIEEQKTRAVWIAGETLRSKPYLLVQSEFGKNFSRMLQMIEEPPRILARLRFMMGIPKEEGVRITCQDPSNKAFVDVATISIMYPEDEDNLKRQLMLLIGKHHRNMMKIVDYSIHNVRNYASTGFLAINERVAIAVLEKYDGPTISEYLAQYSVSNNEYRILLSQVIYGIMGCHEEGVLHRNFHPDCVVVEDPRRKIKGGMAVEGAAKVSSVNCRVGDYWFLYNPRSPGCPYSYGRADWGSRYTVPPEAIRQAEINEKSDIWAFGVCVYHWSTGDKQLPDLTVYKLPDLFNNIQARWGPWVQTLLRMTLQLDSNQRATGKEIYQFLSSRIGKNG